MKAHYSISFNPRFVAHDGPSAQWRRPSLTIIIIPAARESRQRDRRPANSSVGRVLLPRSLLRLSPPSFASPRVSTTDGGGSRVGVGPYKSGECRRLGFPLRRRPNQTEPPIRGRESTTFRCSNGAHLHHDQARRRPEGSRKRRFSLLSPLILFDLVFCARSVLRFGTR